MSGTIFTGSQPALAPTLDSTTITVDTTLITLDMTTFGFGRIASGWPCVALDGNPPSVADRQSDPATEDLLAQVQALTPRGAAWGTDGLGDGGRTSSGMRGFWRAIASWVGDLNRRDFEVASQVLPSAITLSLPDWEDELGLPDLCTGVSNFGTAQRIAAVRARFGAVGGSSPGYFICLAASVGFEVSIEEPWQFSCDESECDGDDELSNQIVSVYWIVHVAALGDTWFLIDEGECDSDPLEGFLAAADLECVLRREEPADRKLVFDYSSFSGFDNGFSLGFG